MNSTLAKTNFAQWEDALLSRDPRKAADLYAKNVTLLPTMAQKIITDREGVEEYFTFFGSFHPEVSMLEEHVNALTEETYLHCGVYRFTLTSEEKKETVDARFTMAWQKKDGGWKILHHHSSRSPMI